MPEPEEKKSESKKPESEDYLEKLVRAVQNRNISGVLKVLFAVSTVAISYLLPWIKDFFIVQVLVGLLALVWTISAVLLIVLYWRSSPAHIKAIKGMSPFTEAKDDAVLLRKLGREPDIEKLVDKVLHNQSPLIVIHGPVGVGITSVLLAGLTYALKKKYGLKDKAICYWRATPDSKLKELQDAIQSDLATGDFRVLIIDQFEFLRPDFTEHKGLFPFLEDVCQGAGSHHFKVKVVIAFRQEYWPTWASVEERLVAGVPSQILEPLDLIDAKEAMAIILRGAGVDIGMPVMERYVERAANGLPVSPFLIGLATSVFARWARNDKRRRVRLRSYWKAGGALGIIADYLEAQLCIAVENHHLALFRMALWQCLVDHESGNRKIEGAYLTNIASSAQIGSKRMHLYLTRCSSDEVRILERVETEPGSEQYRLAHDSFAQVLHACSGQPCTETILAKWSFDEQFERWKQTGKINDLLRGDEIARALRQSRALKQKGPLNEPRE